MNKYVGNKTIEQILEDIYKLRGFGQKEQKMAFKMFSYDTAEGHDRVKEKILYRSFGPDISYLCTHTKEVITLLPPDKSVKITKNKIKSVKEFIKKYVLKPCKKPNLLIHCSLFGKVIPFVDVDSEKSLATAMLWLSESNVRYAVVESNKDHYWIFLDITRYNHKKAVEIACMVPGIDKNYVEAVMKDKTIAIRGMHKHEDKEDYIKFDPHMVEDNTDEGSLVRKFVDQVVEHFKSPELEWLERYYMYKHDMMDIQDPSAGSTKPISLLDFV